MTNIVCYDPGLVTGIAWGHFSDTEPLVFDEWAAWSFGQMSEMFWAETDPDVDVVVAEQFILASNAFAAELTGVRVEGLLLHVYQPGQIHWQLRSDKALVSDQILKDNGMWKTGKDVGWSDGRDCMDAQIHGLAYMMKIRHLPTLKAYFGGA